MIKNSHILASLIITACLAVSAMASHGNCDCGDPCDSGCTHCSAPHLAKYLGPASRRAMRYNWHANYVHSAYGQPVALVVPPTAQLQTDWSWGAPSTRVSRVDHQFGRNYPGSGPFGGSFRRTPAWPSDTAQFGVYNVRGPWYPIQR